MRGEGTECKPEKQSQVSEQLSRLDKELGRAETVQCSMRERVSTVFVLEPPSAGAEKEVAKGEESLVTIASLIREAVQRISSMSDEYDSIIRRIEL